MGFLPIIHSFDCQRGLDITW